MKKAVVYYSVSGSCKNAATAIAESVEADIIEIKAKKQPNTKNPIGFIGLGFKSATKKKIKLEGDINADLSSYDIVYLVSPMRAGNTDPAINTCLEEGDFSNNGVGVFLVKTDSKLTEAGLMPASIKASCEIKGWKV